MTDAASPSRLRRLRDVAMKRSLFEKSVKGESLSANHLELVHNQKIDLLIKQMEDVASFLRFMMSCWYPYYSEWDNLAAGTFDASQTGQASPTYNGWSDLGGGWPTAMPSSEGTSWEHQALIPSSNRPFDETVSMDQDNPDGANLRLCLWKPGDRHVLFQRGSPMAIELEHDAAVHIQSFYRSHCRYSSESNGSEKSVEEDLPCAACGLVVSIEGDEADRCDKCGAVHHHDCLRAYSDIRGEWLVCAACLVKSSQHGGLIQGDFRTIPHDFWERLYKTFPDARGDRHFAKIEPAGQQDRIDVNSLEQFNSTMDFIIRFVEGEHAKSSLISPEIRATIISRVKDALSWNKQPRTDQEIQKQVAELNAMMSEIVKRL